MTAINLIVRSDSAVLISDGAAIKADGTLAHLMNKVVAYPHINAAVGIRGSLTATTIINSAINVNSRSYEDIRARAVDFIRHEFNAVRSALEKLFGSNALDADIVVAGWSERERRPGGFLLVTHNLYEQSGIRAWTPTDVSGVFLAPSNEHLQSEFSRIQIDLDDEMACGLIERQRDVVLPRPGNLAAVPNVGGFVQLTTVHRDSIDTRIVRRFEDRIGSPLARKIHL